MIYWAWFRNEWYGTQASWFYYGFTMYPYVWRFLCALVCLVSSLGALTTVCTMPMQTSSPCSLQSVTYHSRCQWSEPESWMIWTGWCRCVGASPLCPPLCAACWHQHEWAHGKNWCLCPQRVSWELWTGWMTSANIL